MASWRLNTRTTSGLALSALVASVVVAAVACGGGSDSSPGTASAPPENAGATTSHAIHVFIKQPDGSKRQVDFGPGTDTSITTTEDSASGDPLSEPLGRHHPRILEAGAPGDAQPSPITAPPTLADPGASVQSTAWMLAARAAIACGLYNDPESGWPYYLNLPPWRVFNASSPPDAGPPPVALWYLYTRNYPAQSGLPSDCAERLFLEQNLVCIADQLASIGDAVGDVIWPPLQGPNVPPPSAYQYGQGDAASAGDSPDFTMEWDIPPQSDADRFIVRDLAIHTLGMIPVMDAYTDLGGQSCATSFAKVATGTTPAPLYPVTTQSQAAIQQVFGVPLPVSAATNAPVTPFFPPSAVPYVINSSGTNNMPQIAQTALDLNAQILRSGARLLHDLVRRDVYSDLAAAAQQSGQALDPAAGSAAAWGAQGGESLYGTIGHASRVLLGRWEIGDKSVVANDAGTIPTTVSDPQCETTTELNILPGAFGTDYAPRYLDRQIRTSGEQTAAELVERSGIVVPSCQLAAGSAAGLKQALISQLLLQEQVQNNLSSPPPAGALTAVVNGLADSDVVFAFQRAVYTWELLTNTSDPTGPKGQADGGTLSCGGLQASPFLASGGGLPAGLTMATYPTGWPGLSGQPLVAVSVASLDGIVVKGGLSRSRLTTDPMARAGGMLEASQCAEKSNALLRWDEWGVWNPAWSSYLDNNQSYAYLPAADFQDAFHLGQAFERRLNLLLTAASPVTSNTDPVNVAKGGIAELRTWAGATIVHAWPQGTSGAWQSVAVRVSGMSYAGDFGFAPAGAAPTATQLQALANTFGFVYGPPWMAECAAGVRSDCPANFVQTYVATGTQNTGATGTVTAQDVTATVSAGGALDNSFQLTVPLNAFPSPPPVLNPNAVISPSESHLYMIELHDPASAAGAGRVLGTVAVRGVWSSQFTNGVLTYTAVPSITSFVDAPMQRELVHDAIDLGQWVGARPPALGELSAAQTAGYCVDGVPRDLFVPLDNELVAGSQTYEDSWQAYLSLAQTAAQTADTLGQQLIANDLQISQNQQAAEEKLADLCGDFGALASAQVANDGKITADPSDPTAGCLGTGADGGSDIVDVVFLGKLPITITDPTSTAQIKAAINCGDGGPGQTPPTASALCNKPTLTVAALNIGIPDAGLPSDGGVLPSACTDIESNVVPSLQTGFNAQGYLNDLQDTSQTTDAMKSAASQLNMIVDLQDDWQVQYGGQKIMDSQDVAFWPACINSGCTANGSQDDAGVKANLTTTTMAPFWSQVFRNCPPGSAQSAPLGACEVDADTERNMLKWRVTQAMWMLAASAGVLPAGMVYQPIPGRFEGYFGYANTTFPTDGQGDFMNYPDGVANYYGSTFVTSTSCGDPSIPSCYSVFLPQGWSTGDIALVGPLFDINAKFTKFSASNELPAWYKDMYATGAALYPNTKHFFAANSSAVFDPCSVVQSTTFRPPTDSELQYSSLNGDCQSKLASLQAGASNTAGGGSSGGQSQSAGSALASTPVSFATILGGGSSDGARCSSFTGPETSLTGLAALVANVKLGLIPEYTFPSIGPGRPELPTSISAYTEIVGQSATTWCDFPGSASVSGTEPDKTRVACAVLAAPSLMDTFIYASTNSSTWDVSGTGLQYPAGTKDTTGGFNPAGTPDTNGGATGWYPATSWRTFSPTEWPPQQRALAYAGYGAAPNGTCGALSLLLQASALACTPSPSAPPLAVNLGSPPSVTKLSDVPALEGWLANVSARIQSSTGGFYLQEIPKQVVSDFNAGTIGSGPIGGTKGQAVLTMEQQIQQFPSSWTSISSDLAQISSAITIANGAIVAANLSEQTADGSLALQAIQTQGTMTLAVDNFLVTLANASASAVNDYGAALAVIPAAALTLADSIAIGNQEISQIQQMENTASQTDENQVNQALAQMTATTGPLWADVQKQIDNLRGYMAQIDAQGQIVVQTENQAAYEVAVGTGADFVQIAGQEVPIPVDTVLRRQASATLQRYQAALTNAKALAYMARRAIEQRIGVPLDALTQQVGPVDAPASWADNICSLQGVNYAELSSADPDGGGAGSASDQAAISAFADGWVGDYVAKLQQFVTYYNVQYPSHQGQDTAILSLRYDLLPPATECTVQAPNVLANSGDLSQLGGGSWGLSPCNAGAGKCLSVIGGYALPSPSGPWGAQVGSGATFTSPSGGADQLFTPAATGVTWLLDVPQAPATSSDAGPSDGGPDATTANDDAGATLPNPSPSGPSEPGNLVIQQVQLSAGTYVLSWWDQARDANGNIVWAGGAASPPNYLAEVFDPSWNSVAMYDQQPYTPAQVGNAGGAELWSTRHALSFTVENAGTYSVAFGASQLAGAAGSVAVADVQLEQAANGQPTTYVETTATTMVEGLDCPMTDDAFRAAFTHACDDNGKCHYDLAVPFLIDTSVLDGSPLDAKLASGNYNYRQINTALNLVGTGVHNCANDPTPNCYGSGYIEYNLQHDAQNAGIVGYDGNSRVFDFGVASISGGKALAAERYITMPLSSTDQSLVSQPGIQHVEYGGRPLDGTYYLRIWDSPDLDWSALQDIQFIVNYEYWSQIQVTQDRTGVSRPQRLHRTMKPLVKSLMRRH